MGILGHPEILKRLQKLHSFAARSYTDGLPQTNHGVVALDDLGFRHSTRSERCAARLTESVRAASCLVSCRFRMVSFSRFTHRSCRREKALWVERNGRECTFFSVGQFPRTLQRSVSSDLFLHLVSSLGPSPTSPLASGRRTRSVSVSVDL